MVWYLLLTHSPPRIQAHNSPSAIFAILQRQVQELVPFQSSAGRWTKWIDLSRLEDIHGRVELLNPTVNVLQALSATLGEGVGLACLRTQETDLPEIRTHIYLASILTCETDLPGLASFSYCGVSPFFFRAQPNVLQRT
jgi:hypothetical protein